VTLRAAGVPARRAPPLEPSMRALTLTLRILACALLAGLILTPFAQIIMRGVFNVPMAGAEELARYHADLPDFPRRGAGHAWRAGRSAWRNSRR
jgi:hypothetical protein